MHIFIDESGSFVKGSGARGLSIVGALIIPEGRMANIDRKYAAIRTRLPKEKGEVKGRMLSAAQVFEVTNLLRRNDAILELVGIDLNLHTETDLHTHKEGQAAGLMRGVTDAHHPALRASVSELAQRITALPNQLYAQGCAMMELVWSACEIGINYFGQRQPRELARFFWTIDGKDKTKTNWEDLWESILLPLLQSKSIRKPHRIFEDCDLTHFARFEDTRPEWLPKPANVAGDTVTNIRLLLMEYFRYSSNIEAGLELADIVTSAARRALVGTLEPAGYAGIPSLMIHRRDHYIKMVALHGRPIDGRVPYRSVLLHRFTRGGRNFFAPRFLRDD